MKKLSNLIFVRREGLDQKWWHRLAQVLILGSTSVLLILVLINFCTQEHKYKSGISLTPPVNSMPILLDCFKLQPITLSVDQFAQNIKSEYSVYQNINNKILVRKVLEKVPECREIVKWDPLIHGFVLELVAVAGWFILWESVIYRAIIYIIYGNRKK